MNKFQVVAMTKNGYIDSYKDFHWNEMEGMLKHLQYLATSRPINKIEITRWNDKGERE